MVEEETPTQEGAVKGSGDLPTTKVTPDFHQKLKDMKQQYGYRNVQQVQDHILELIATMEKKGGGTALTPEQLQQQKMMVESTENVVAIGDAVDPIDRAFKMAEKQYALDFMKTLGQGQQGSSGGGQLDLGQVLQMQIIKGMMRSDELGALAMMKAFDSEGTSRGDDRIKDLLHQMEEDRREFREQLGRIERTREEDKAEDQRLAAKAEADNQREVLMAFMQSNQEANHAFLASMTQMVTESRAQGLDDVEIATQALQRQAAFVASIRETGKLLGLQEADVEKEAVAAERTTADKIKSVFDGVGDFVDKVSPLFEKALTGDQVAPPHAVVPPPGGAPPAMTAQDMPSGLTQEVLQAAMASKPQGQNWIFTQNELDAMLANIPADKELPPLTVMPTPQGNCYLLSNDEREYIEGLAAQAGPPAAEEGPEVKPGEREWVAPPEEEVAEPGEEPSEEPPGTTPPGDEEPKAAPKVTVRASVSPPEELEGPPAPEMHTCARCAETKPMPTPPYCAECWILERAECARCGETKDIPVPPYCEDCWKVEKAEAEEIAEEILEEDKRAFGNSCRWCEKKCKSRAGRSSHERSCPENPANNPLVCRWCGKKCKSPAGRSSHEKSCPENPANKENE